MNIFVLDNNPYVAAEYHNDKHVVKMILESAQMLTTICNTSLTSEYKPYILHKRYHKHPCVQWLEESKTNIEWLSILFKALLNEYKFRYRKPHNCLWMLNTFNCTKDFSSITPINFPLAMPDEWKPWYFATRAEPKSAVLAYKKYYYFDKQHLATWTNRLKPSWYTSSYFLASAHL